MAALLAKTAKPVAEPPRSFHIDRFAGEVARCIAEGDADELLTVKVVMAIAHVSEQTLDIWRRKGIGPAWVRLGPRLIRYRRGDLVEWLRSRSAQFETPAPKPPSPIQKLKTASPKRPPGRPRKHPEATAE
jgi:predicted DNA-binding transcriptional regulator AlpA